MLRDVLAALRARPRTVFTGAGMVVVAVLAMVLIPTLTGAASAKVLSDLDALGSDAWVVAPHALPGRSATLPAGGWARSSDLPGVTSALDEVTTTVPVTLSAVGSSSDAVELVGVDGTPGASATSATSGVTRPVPDLPFALIGQRAAAALGVTQFPTYLYAGKHALVVTGVLTGDPLLPELNGALVTDVATAKKLAGRGADTTEQLVVRTASSVSPTALRRAVDPTGTSALSVSRPEALVTARASSTTTLGGLAIAASSIAFAIAALGISIMLTASVRQRTAELAVRRVHGARRTEVFGLITAEALAIGLIGGVAGLVLSAIAGYATLTAMQWPMQDHFVRQLVALGAAVVVSTLASLPPAAVALRIQPARAFAVQ